MPHIHSHENTRLIQSSLIESNEIGDGKIQKSQCVYSINLTSNTYAIITTLCRSNSNKIFDMISILETSLDRSKIGGSFFVSFCSYPPPSTVAFVISRKHICYILNSSSHCYWSCCSFFVVVSEIIANVFKHSSTKITVIEFN